MERTLIPTFETPSFSKRLKSMLGVDFYRLFHTPLFYIMVAISAILCLVFLHRLSGVREGTVICALFTGNIVKLYRLILGKLFPEQTWMQIPQK